MEDQGLPESYLTVVEKHIALLAQHLASLANIHEGAIRIGINGSQGSGKSTLALFLSLILRDEYQLNVVNLSIDDFYHTYQTRCSMGEQIHPLLCTRGVPGTHDVTLLQATLNALEECQENQEVHIPRFDKSIDDRRPSSQWDLAHGRVDVIILEGWCVGAEPQSDSDLQTPVNSLEEIEDTEGFWRQYVNSQLAGAYKNLFDSLQYLVMLKAPSFDSVYQWRLLQEKKLSAKAIGDSARIMSEEQINRFIQHYQRITEVCLKTLPSRADCLLKLDFDHGVEEARVGLLAEEKAIVVSDLDGTLLDHHTYDFSAALPALKALEKADIPVILNTSKTAAELCQLRQVLGNDHPFIAENGSVVYLPMSIPGVETLNLPLENQFFVKRFGCQREDILEIVRRIRTERNWRFEGFSDWSVDKVVEQTGLKRREAELAMQRNYSEPLLWFDSDSNYSKFVEILEREGYNLLQGGRFIHILGNVEKGSALLWLKRFYGAASREDMKVVALGDSQNDVAMLNAADIAVVVRSTQHLPDVIAKLIVRKQKIIITQAYGPEGWHQAILQLLGRRCLV